MKKLLVLIVSVLLVTINSNPNIFADDSTSLPETPEQSMTLTGSRKTARYGDEMVVKLDGVSFNNPIGIKNLKFDYYTEAIDTTQELQEIVIPRFDAIANGNEDGVALRIMAIVQNGSSLRVVKDIVFMPNDGQESVVIPREEIMQWAQDNNNGELPKILYYNFSNTKDGVIDLTMSRVFYELRQSAPIEYRYKVVEGVPYKGATYQLYQGSLSWYTTEINNRTAVTKSVTPYFETSDITVTSNKTEGLKPGDLVELNVTVTNNSSLANQRLWIGLEAEGLELVSEEAKSRADLGLSAADWQTNGNHFYAPIYINGAWTFINPTKEYTTTQLFRVLEDYNESTINVMPYLFTNGGLAEREYNEGIDIELDIEKNDEETQIPEENNGPNEPGNETENPGNEVETPEEENPGNEVETPEEETPGNEVETPEEENPGNEVETPEEENPGNEVETPEEETPETQTPGTRVPDVDNGSSNGGTVNPSIPVETPDIPVIVDTDKESSPKTEEPNNESQEQTDNKDSSENNTDKQKPETGEKTERETPVLPNTGMDSKSLLYIGTVLIGLAFIVVGGLRKKHSK